MISRTRNLSVPTSSRWLAVAVAPAMGIIVVIDLRFRGNEWVLTQGIDPHLRGWVELLLRGMADEIAHLLTALVIVAAIRVAGIPVNWIAAAIGAVVIDLEYLLLLQNITEALAGSQRGFAHTLGPALGMILLGLIVAPARTGLISLGIGMLTHLLRDSATASAPLLWPLRDRAFHLHYAAYLTILVACTVAVALNTHPHAANRDGKDAAG